MISIPALDTSSMSALCNALAQMTPQEFISTRQVLLDRFGFDFAPLVQAGNYDLPPAADTVRIPFTVNNQATGGTPGANVNAIGNLRRLTTGGFAALAAGATAQPAVAVQLVDTLLGTIWTGELAAPINGAAWIPIQSGIVGVGGWSLSFVAACAAGVIASVNLTGFHTP